MTITHNRGMGHWLVSKWGREVHAWSFQGRCSASMRLFSDCGRSKISSYSIFLWIQTGIPFVAKESFLEYIMKKASPKSQQKPEEPVRMPFHSFLSQRKEVRYLKWKGVSSLPVSCVWSAWWMSCDIWRLTFGVLKSPTSSQFLLLKSYDCTNVYTNRIL